MDLKSPVTRRSHVNAVPPTVKTNAFLNGVLSVLEAECEEPFDHVFLDAQGYLTEGTVWNVFMIKDKVLYTPGTGILDGVTRRFVIECAGKEHLPVQQTFLTRHDFWNAHEAFITNTSGEIVPVRSLDSRTIGTRIPGLRTLQLMTRFQKELKRELGHGHQKSNFQRFR